MLFGSAAWLLSYSMSPDLAATIAAALPTLLAQLPTLSPCSGDTLTNAMSASVGRCPLALNRQRCPPAPLCEAWGSRRIAPGKRRHGAPVMFMTSSSLIM